MNERAEDQRVRAPSFAPKRARFLGIMVVVLTTTSLAQAQWQSSGANIYNTNTGNVGIGTTSPTQKLHLGTGNLRLADASLGDVGNLYLGGVSVLGQTGMRLFGGLVNGTIPAGFIDVRGAEGLYIRVDNEFGGTTRMNIAANGTVTVYGDLAVNGNIAAKYQQDIAEWVTTRSSLPVGTLVSVDRTRPNEVTPSSIAYDTSVAGVITDTPGLVLGEAGKEKVMVATFGRVRVRVDAGPGPIRIGDLLVSSATPGVAMRSQPVDLAGITFHRPGTIIGKALESLEAGKGEILVLLSLQ